MDADGRLHMPGFVGQSFQETGLEDEAALPKSEDGRAENRQQRRAREALERKLDRLKA